MKLDLVIELVLPRMRDALQSNGVIAVVRHPDIIVTSRLEDDGAWRILLGVTGKRPEDFRSLCQVTVDRDGNVVEEAIFMPTIIEVLRELG